MVQSRLRAAEFFAGIGLVRKAIESEYFEVVWANDIDSCKRNIYVQNFGSEHFRLGDIRDVKGDEIPTIDLATASFPCTDLSLAGNRGGIRSGESSMFWEFARVIREMEDRRPRVVVLENVPGFATSNGGKDLLEAIRELNSLGYSCDVLVINAAHFVPQSRSRLFIIAVVDPDPTDGIEVSAVRPPWILDLFDRNRDSLRLHARRLDDPPKSIHRFASVVQRLSPTDVRWWEPERLDAFIESLSPLQRARLDAMQAGRTRKWRTAYRRTRNGRAVWEMRNDELAGCLRTARGGSSKQAVVEAGGGSVRVRWMTAREYAALQGAPTFEFNGIAENKALFGFGDAVCVPVIAWLTEAYVSPILHADRLTAA